MATDVPQDPRKDQDEPPPNSPYGPQRDGVDEAAGGADSSPFENMSSDERHEEAQRREGAKDRTRKE